MQYFLGILSFFGLDEYSRLERKYAKEIEGKADNQFEEELKDVLRRGILETKVKAFPFFYWLYVVFRNGLLCKKS